MDLRNNTLLPMSQSSSDYRPGIFPDPRKAGKNGLLASGGDLAEPTLLEAYSKGIFPWYSEDTPILWWSPDPRMVLFPGRFRVSKSLLQSVRNRGFRVVFDRDFGAVIESCATVPRKGRPGTWITAEMKEAYSDLHRAGYAHSVESYLGNDLVGGLYGVSLGGAFFGESMFHMERDASKVALFYLVERLRQWEFDLIDVQQSTAHMKSLGAEDIPRSDFLAMLVKSLKKPTRKGDWGS
jgi:leucyl/phenylalanyl-tRNA--protein transferase